MTELAVITGGAKGIGKSYATHLARRGADLVLIDIAGDALQDVAQDLRERFGARVTTRQADLSQPDAQAALATEIAALERIDLLINAAGYGEPVAFDAHPAEAQIAMINVHVTAMVRLCRAALPGMLARGTGAIITISSQTEFFHASGNAIYGSTKRFVSAFSRNLDHGYRAKGLRVQLLVPAYIRTSFHDSAYYGAEAMARVPGFFWMDVDEVTGTSLAQLDGGRLVCVPGVWHKLTYHVLRLGLIPRFILKRTI